MANDIYENKINYCLHREGLSEVSLIPPLPSYKCIFLKVLCIKCSVFLGTQPTWWISIRNVRTYRFLLHMFNFRNKQSPYDNRQNSQWYIPKHKSWYRDHSVSFVLPTFLNNLYLEDLLQQNRYVISVTEPFICEYSVYIKCRFHFLLYPIFLNLFVYNG